MNPSYENGGQHIPGVKPGVIASGPEPESPISPAAGPVANPAPTNPGVIASGPEPENVEPRPITTPAGLSLSSTVSRQPTGGRPMIASMPTDDIMLAGSEAPSTNKKGLIIGGVIAGVVILVGAIVAVMMLGQGGNSTTSGNADQNLFSKYFNFLVNTEDFAVNQDSEYDRDKIYGVQAAFNNRDTEYFSQLGALWHNFYDKVKEENKYSDVSKIMGDIRYEDELVDFVTKYIVTTIWDDEGILKLYLENGLKDATARVEENYKELTKTTYEPGKRFAEIMQTHAKIYLANFAKIDAAGCMTNGEINYDCVSSNAERIYASDDAASSSYASPEDAFVDAEDGKELMEDVILSLPEFGFRINDDFKKENEK